MKVLLTVLSASALISTFAFAKPAAMNQNNDPIRNEMQKKSTDELLEKRGNMHNQQEREALHNELMAREQKMTKEQKEKFGKAPEKVSQEMGEQGKGKGYGQGQGMMQGNPPEKVSQGMGEQGKGNAYGEGQGMMMQEKQKEMMQNKDQSMMGGGKVKSKGGGKGGR